MAVSENIIFIRAEARRQSQTAKTLMEQAKELRKMADTLEFIAEGNVQTSDHLPDLAKMMSEAGL
jgi:hypothetical protein